MVDASSLDLKSVRIPPRDWLCCNVGEDRASRLDFVSVLSLLVESGGGARGSDGCGSDFSAVDSSILILLLLNVLSKY